MGDKITAKTLAEKAGIQTVPGYKDEILGPVDLSNMNFVQIKSTLIKANVL